MTFLVDYNLDGYALLFLGMLTKLGWLKLLPIQFITFREAGLSMDSSDRLIWQYAQSNKMMILTANCNGLQLSESGIAIIGTLGQD